MSVFHTGDPEKMRLDLVVVDQAIRFGQRLKRLEVAQPYDRAIRRDLANIAH